MAANKCSAASAPQTGNYMAPRGQAVQMSLSSAVAHLNMVSAGVSVEPAEYSWGTPSLLQQQALYTQFLQLAFMCTLPQMQYAHLSAVQTGRAAMFPGFMPSCTGYLPPMVPSCAPNAPSPAPCSPPAPQGSGQQEKESAALPETASGRTGKVASPSKKAAPKTKPAKFASGVNTSLAAPAAGSSKAEADMELEDICRLLGDDAFLEHLQDDVLSEGSNGSSATMDGHALSKNNSNGSLCISGAMHNNGDVLFPGTNFASTFDMDMDDAPSATTAAAAQETAWNTAPSQLPVKARSGDLNNMVASSPVNGRSTRSSRCVAREATTAGRESTAATTTGTGAAVTKITLKVKGGVQKASASKSSKAQVSAAVVASAGTAAPAAVTDAAPASQPAAEECTLSAADLSRLLGEDDNRIPEGWDLDLDFENPFSCSISAF